MLRTLLDQKPEVILVRIFRLCSNCLSWESHRGDNLFLLNIAEEKERGGAV